MVVYKMGNYSDCERASCTEHAFDIDCSLHQIDQLFHDGQAKPHSPISAGVISFALNKRLEHGCNLVFRNPDPCIGYRENQFFLCCTDIHIQADTSNLGVLHGITKKVDQYLLYAQRINFYFFRNRALNRNRKLETLFICKRSDLLRDTLDQISNTHVSWLKLNFSRLNMSLVK